MEWDWEARSPKLWDELLDNDGYVVHKLDTVEWEFKNRVLSVQNVMNGTTVLPLHPNVRLLLETIAQLNPKRVADFGCGFGDTLHSAGLLLPSAKLYGYDISPHRLARLRERSPLLADRVILQQCDLGIQGDFTPVELAYTSTVIMHIVGERRLVALRNVFETATRHVVLMENWGSHPFMEDIKLLHSREPFTGWNKLHFYYRYCVEFARPHLMIVSKDKNLPYERLLDYDATMRQPLAKAMQEGRP
jgi:SAM-dependent methyltransferase